MKIYMSDDCNPILSVILSVCVAKYALAHSRVMSVITVYCYYELSANITVFALNIYNSNIISFYYYKCL